MLPLSLHPITLHKDWKWILLPLPFSSLHCTTLLLVHITDTFSLSLLCSLKDVENQFYSTLVTAEWHNSDFFFVSFLWINLFPKNQFLPSACILQPPGIHQKNGTLHSCCLCPAAAPECSCISIQVVSFVSFRGTLLPPVSPMCPLWTAASASLVKWTEGIKRSLKRTGPSVAPPPATPPIDKVKPLVWSWELPSPPQQSLIPLSRVRLGFQ